jgi:predicted acetyltransferase
MIQSRAARSDELDAMLALMCETFDLPLAPARDLFYKDPYFDIEKKRILQAGGELVSCLTIVDAAIWIGKAPVKLGGIAGVATHPSHRSKGHATRLLKDSLPVLREQGYSFAALFPYSYGFYRRLGWELGSRQYRLSVSPAALPHYEDARYVRAALPSDRADVARLYERASLHRTGRWLRDDKRWSYLFEHVKNEVIYKRRQMEGYAFFEVKEDERRTRSVRLLELTAPTSAAQRGLTTYLAQITGVTSIAYTGAWEDLAASGLLAAPDGRPDEECATVQASQGAMFRVVDLVEALNALVPNFSGLNGAVTLSMQDDTVPAGFPRTATVEGDGNVVMVRPGDGHPRRVIEGDVRTWSAVLVGYQSLEDALALNLLRSYSEATTALAAPLFPRRDPFIPTVDHF